MYAALSYETTLTVTTETMQPLLCKITNAPTQNESGAGYLDGDLADEDPMLRAFSAGKESFQHIRCVPLPQVLGFLACLVQKYKY